MTRQRWLLLLIALLVLTVLLAACGGGDESPTAAPPADTEQTTAATDTPVPAPTDTPVTEPADKAVSGSEFDSASVASLEELFDSYRATMSLLMSATYADGTVEEQNVEMAMDWVKTDNENGGDTRIEILGVEGTGEEEAPASMTIYSIDDTVYMNIGGQWMSSAREGDQMEGLGDLYQDPEQLLGDVKDLKKVGKKTINGIDTIHYSFEESALFDDLFGKTTEEFPGELQEANGDIWVAEDGSYIVRFSFEAKATGIPDTDESGNETTVDVSMKYEFDISEVNTLDSIELPEDAPQAGQVTVPGFEPGEFPMPPDTVVEASFGGLITLASDLSEKDANAFYDKALADLGWAKAEGIMPTWSKDGISITILVTPGETGGTNIMIMAEEP